MSCALGARVLKRSRRLSFLLSAGSIEIDFLKEYWVPKKYTECYEFIKVRASVAIAYCQAVWCHVHGLTTCD